MRKYVSGNSWKLTVFCASDFENNYRELEWKIKDKMYERSDYQAYYFMPPASNYYKVVKEKADEIRDLDDISTVEV